MKLTRKVVFSDVKMIIICPATAKVPPAAAQLDNSKCRIDRSWTERLHYITSHHITSHHITSHHITSHHITSHHITSHHITPHHITLHQLHCSTSLHHITTQRKLLVILSWSVLSWCVWRVWSTSSPGGYQVDGLPPAWNCEHLEILKSFSIQTPLDI